MPTVPDSTVKAKYWMLTIPANVWQPVCPKGFQYVKGQKEKGEGGYEHWQVLAISTHQTRRSGVKKAFGKECHCEPSRSTAADEYVWKEATRIAGTQFELGKKLMRRDNAKDWEQILSDAKRGDFTNIPADVYIRNYGNLRKIAVENAQPVGLERVCVVYWGATGSGKSRTAWQEAGLDAYPKDPCTKFWDGYRGQDHVVIDEFRGVIGISHLLRWLDRYPVLVEVKGSSTVFKATKIWITSNLHPREWYKDLDQLSYEALERRLQIVEMN